MSRTVAASHNDWLTLVEQAGAFLTLPVVKRVFPNGVPPVDRDVRGEVRSRLEALPGDVAARTGWLQFVLRELLGLDERLRESAGVPSTLTHVVPEHGTTLRPDFALVGPGADGKPEVRLIVCRWPLRTPLDVRPTHDAHGQPTRWAATPIERAAVLCRAVNVPLALVTDTDRFVLVWAPRNGPSGHGTWVSSLFAEERGLLDAFVAMLGAHRFFGVASADTPEAMLRESGEAQQEITDRLGHQVREAVELLVSAFSRAHRASGGALLAGLPPEAIYNAAVTVLMRLVVLLSAEERRLFPIDDEIYAGSYSVLTLRESLQDQANRDGIDALEKRCAAWHRLLALFRVVFEGVSHDRLHLPPYGGSLFDPSRYPFLEGRSAAPVSPVEQGFSPASRLGSPIPVDDRTVLAILDSLQVLTFRQGGITEARRLSYRNLSVGQIGHVYEGLLDHGCRAANDAVLGLLGKKGDEPEITLATLEAELGKGHEAFGAWMADQGGPAATRVAQLLFEELEPEADHRLRAACDNDEATFARVRPFAGLLRRDLRDLPMVFLPGSLYVTQTSLRRDSGTAYTTEELADEVVQHALEPAVYSPGPAEGAEPKDWALRPAAEILALKVCDPAVGSGAILVAACRYLADRVVEAWQAEPPDQAVATTRPSHLPVEDWTLHARRLVVDHCLYGVDRNPMAVEMAKLSMWLTTLARERPFTFLDHQLRCGDSLLGITTLDQVRYFHIDPERGKERPPVFGTVNAIEERVDAALAVARELSAIDVVTLRDAERKARLHGEMVGALRPLATVADLVIGAALSTSGSAERSRGARAGERGPREDVADRLVSVADDVARAFAAGTPPETQPKMLASLGDTAAYWLDTDRPAGAPERQPLHWPLAFPEVFLRDGLEGFDAIVGNPPFLGGQRITGAIGTGYRNYLVERIAGGQRGSADLVAYFFLRAVALLRQGAGFGLLATNTIAQGDTREVGLDRIAAAGGTIVRAVPSEKWPGTANLEVAKVWVRRGGWRGPHVLSDRAVSAITPFLAEPGRVAGTPFRLKANESKSFIGSYVLGMGFVMTPEEADALIAKDAKNRDVLFPYLNGEDLNSRWDQSPSRWVINFRDWPLERSAEGRWDGAGPAEVKAWLRSGRVPADYPDRVAADYPDCLDLVTRLVKPERDLNNRAVYRDRWWHYAEKRPDLYATIAGMERVLAKSEVGNKLSFAFRPTTDVFSHMLVVFASGAWRNLAILQSTIHDAWAFRYGSTMRTDLRYTPSDCFETFPFPPGLDPTASVRTSIALAAKSVITQPSASPVGACALDDIGLRYDAHRRSITTARREGLTKTYNRFHNPAEAAADIVGLRELHVEMDHAVAAAYGWNDLALDHGFHETKQGLRFTVGPVARQEILDRMLELNHQRYAEEVAAGLHEKAGGGGRKAGLPRRSPDGEPPTGLF